MESSEQHSIMNADIMRNVNEPEFSQHKSSVILPKNDTSFYSINHHLIELPMFFLDSKDEYKLPSAEIKRSHNIN